MLEKMTCYLPAGGRGERLHPLTQRCPKPALQMGPDNKLIDHSIDTVPEESNLVVSVFYCGHIIVDHLSQHQPNQPTKILFDNSLYDIGGSMAEHAEDLDSVARDYLLVLPTDHVLQGIDLHEMLKCHTDSEQDVTILVTDPKKYGDYLQVKGEKVVGVSQISEPGNAGNESTYSSTGIYLFNTAFLMGSIRKKLKQGWQGERIDLTREIVFPAIDIGKVRIFRLDDAGYWDDAGTMLRYYQNNMHLSGGGNVISSTARVESGVELDQVVVLDGAKVTAQGGLSRTIVAPNSEITGKHISGSETHLTVLYNNNQTKHVKMDEN